jgi:hypothetical protein
VASKSDEAIGAIAPVLVDLYSTLAVVLLALGKQATGEPDEFSAEVLRALDMSEKAQANLLAAVDAARKLTAGKSDG